MAQKLEPSSIAILADKGLLLYPNFRNLRGDPEFEALLVRIHTPRPD